MKLKQLKDWINKLPIELEDHTLIYRVFNEIDTDTDKFNADDIHIAAVGVDNRKNNIYCLAAASALLIRDARKPIQDGKNE